MTDQNTQNPTDPQDELDTMVQEVNKISNERKDDNNKLINRLNSLDVEVDALSKKTDDVVTELNQAEKEAGDELDQLMIEEAEELAEEDEEDAVEED